MDGKLILLTLASGFLLCTMIITSVVAQPRIVGVSVSDWFKFGEVTGNWSSDDPSAIFPSLEFNETEWMLMSVTDVSGTNVTFQSIWHFTNGTEKIDYNLIDIDTGNGNGTFSVISANLNTNDTVYSLPCSTFITSCPR